MFDVNEEEGEVFVRNYISITSGIRGWFAVHIGVYKHPKYGEYHEPIMTSHFTSKDREGAVVHAKEWAKAEELPCECE
jgi:hypothetical protein